MVLGDTMYIARQPIFKVNMDVYGYELLFRAKKESVAYDGLSATSATASVISGLMEEGFSTIVDNKRAFINFNEELLTSDVLELINKDTLVIELLETVEVNDSIKNRMKELKSAGYEIALDDFQEDYKGYPLKEYAKIIKFDLIRTPLESIRESVRDALSEGKILLAEKVETESEFLLAKSMGFKLFQGFFFSRPTIVGKNKAVRASTQNQYLRIFKELQKEEPSFQVLAEIIEKDVALSYKLLRVIKEKSQGDLVYSIKKALSYMGLKELDRWIRILMIQDLGSEKPKELVYVSLIRSKLAEEIAVSTHLKNARYEASMMGLFSTLDALLDMDMEEALKGVNLSPRVSSALLHSQGELSLIRQIIESQERGEWQKLDLLASVMNVKEEEVYGYYMKAVRWAKEVMELLYD
ncbi:EAL and modified HD-GYP domain-containing signal transduction protein [Proteiniclasticum ruminis]|uniref:EAL and modified HD-GYP domain-containing signal transduction protein n=2 Tax=Proteiniclasticum ruminis TaxID=398199 RepID=A0A1I4XKS1_9CLOT|nr:EAL and modified HD-GYP domain-containing signal transduction protein [Proteiniclasticum ruminis]